MAEQFTAIKQRIAQAKAEAAALIPPLSHADKARLSQCPAHAALMLCQSCPCGQQLMTCCGNHDHAVTMQARLRDDLNRLPDHQFYACIENIIIARDESAAQHTDVDYDLNLEALDAPCLRALQVCSPAGLGTDAYQHVPHARVLAGLLRGLVSPQYKEAELPCMAKCIGGGWCGAAAQQSEGHSVTKGRIWVKPACRACSLVPKP